jgi:hypothetical protein
MGVGHRVCCAETCVLTFDLPAYQIMRSDELALAVACDPSAGDQVDRLIVNTRDRAELRWLKPRRNAAADAAATAETAAAAAAVTALLPPMRLLTRGSDHCSWPLTTVATAQGLSIFKATSALCNEKQSVSSRLVQFHVPAL